MSQQHLAIVKAAYEAFNEPDIPAVLALLDDSVQWTEPGGGRAPSGTFQGPAAVAKQGFGRVPEAFDELRADVEQFIDAGEHVIAVGRFRGKTKNGAAADMPFVHVHRVSSGKITEFHNYVEAAGWAEAWA